MPVIRACLRLLMAAIVAGDRCSVLVSSLQCIGGGMRLAIHAPNLGLSLPDQPFGKDVANRGLYTALATMVALSRSASARRSSRRYPLFSGSLGPRLVLPAQRFAAHANGCCCPGRHLAPRSALSFRTGLGAGPSSWASGLQPGGDDPHPGSSQGARADR